MRVFSHLFSFWQHLKTGTNTPFRTTSSRNSPFFVPVCPSSTGTTIVFNPLVPYVKLCYNNRVVKQFSSTAAQRTAVNYQPTQQRALIMKTFDLVDEMQWEDIADELGLLVSLEEAGLEEYVEEPLHGQHYSNEGSIYSYTDWFYDGDDQAFSVI